MSNMSGAGSESPRDVFSPPGPTAEETRQAARLLREQELEEEHAARRRNAETRAAEFAAERERIKLKAEADRLNAIEEEKTQRALLAKFAEAKVAAAVKQTKPANSTASRRKMQKLYKEAGVDDIETSEAPDLIRDILWVYDRIDAIEVGKAPGRGAVSLWEYVRDCPMHRKWFFQLMLPKALAVKEREEKRKEEERTLDKDVGIEEVARLLRSVNADDPYVKIHELNQQIDALKVEIERLQRLAGGHTGGAGLIASSMSSRSAERAES